ncbi:MAG: hypothetical protein K6F57_03870 [Candidatus Saccharibacteria bacterium]|nr:hypothetical protein [Candidatus Saccharibacteria bacterium]
MREVKDIIVSYLYDEENERAVAGRVRLQLAAFAKKSVLSDSEEEEYADFLGVLGLTEEEPYYVFTINTTEESILFMDGGRPLCLSTLPAMMEAWVCRCRCIGEEFSYQVAIDDIRHEAICEEYTSSYGCRPEESGLSPRAGSMVVELISQDIDWLTVQLNITCLSELGAKRDMEIALWAACYIVEHIAGEEYNLQVSGAYPNNSGVDINY